MSRIEQGRGSNPETGKNKLHGLTVPKKGIAITGAAAIALIWAGYEIKKHKKQSSQPSPPSETKTDYRQ